MGRSEAPRPVSGYVIHGPIASGGTATVHYGWREGAAGFGRLVAVKALHPHLAKEPEVVAMLVDEARLASRLHHPNVVPVLDVVQTEDELLLVMEYVAGVPLSFLLRRAGERDVQADPRMVVAIGSSILRALHAAHETADERGQPLGLVHRDVSPQNVLVGSDGVVRLVDFGIAKATGRVQMTRDGQRKGKLAYMAPEQVEGGAIDRRCDVYAASIVLWELLTGEQLFSGGDETAVLRRRVEEVRPPSAVRTDLPRAFDDVIMRGLSREPRRRFPTARAMAEALETCAAQVPPSEVADWLRELAADALAEREAEASRVEATHAERGAAAAGAVVSMLKVSTPATARVHTPKSLPEIPPAPERRRLRAALSVIAALAFVAFVVIAFARNAPRAEPVGPMVSASAPAPSAPTSAASGSSIAADAHDAGAADDAVDHPEAERPGEKHPPSKLRAHPMASTPARRPKSGPACTPPFRVDANGVRRYKLECL